MYCDATHPNSPNGCYEAPDHTGQHRGILEVPEPYTDFYWDDAPEGASVYLTLDELGILLTTLEPVKQFFPGLLGKLETARGQV